MSFRLFIYYCATWGAAAAFFGWALGQVLEGSSPLLGAALKGLALGLFVALGLGVLDALAAGSHRDATALGIRLTLALLIGSVGGLIGGFVGQGFYQLSDGKMPVLLVFGWVLTGLLIGGSPAAFDFLGAVLRNEDRVGPRRKLRNGLIGGTIGGLIGGFVSMFLHNAWASLFPNTDAQSLWLPSATGFVALGASIGLAVALAQIMLREAWLRVEAGFRPGRQILLSRSEATIGRAESCDVGLFGDTGIEKLHARIAREGNRWVLSNSAATAGTLLNGQPITAPTLLHDGDRIQVGNSVLSFGLRAKESAPPAAVGAT